LTDETATSCYLGKIFQYRQLRSGFDTDCGLKSYCHSFNLAKDQVENKRVKASNWKVVEIPVLVFNGEVSSLLIGQKETSSPFSEKCLTKKRILSIKEYASEFLHEDNFRIICEKNFIPPAELPFFEYHSDYIPGGRYYLRWNVDKYNINLDSILKLVLQVNKNIQEFS
jgi:hypothetical protein